VGRAAGRDPQAALTQRAKRALAEVRDEHMAVVHRPEVDQRAPEGLKFSEALPESLAAATLAARLADLKSAVQVVNEFVRLACGL
jgi:ATP-dependent helicase Lhr and Lhr-like helicase